MQKNKEDDEKIEDLPIEEFENDKQDIREEFLKEFGEKKEEENEVKKGYEQWL